MYETIIIGSGPAGLNAALYLKRANKNVIVIEKEFEGAGQITQSICVENYLGFPKISGEELGETFRRHVLKFDVPFLEDDVIKIEQKVEQRQNIWQVTTVSGKLLEGKTLIYAAGSAVRRLQVPGEQKFFGKGISYCAYCDGFFYQDQEVAVIGGGDTALDAVEYLSGLCSHVYLIHRRAVFRGNPAVAERLMQRENVEMILEASVKEVGGDSSLEYVLLEDGRKINISGLFVAIGSNPESNLVKQYVQRDENGYILCGEDGITAASGLFAAGDVRTKNLRQVITAVSDGANAAASVIQYLSNRD